MPHEPMKAIPSSPNFVTAFSRAAATDDVVELHAGGYQFANLRAVGTVRLRRPIHLDAICREELPQVSCIVVPDIDSVPAQWLNLREEGVLSLDHLHQLFGLHVERLSNGHELGNRDLAPELLD
jgi:hypothetical protein